MIKNLYFFLYESIIGMKRSGIMIYISIATTTISLILFGLFLLISVNINNFTAFLTDKLEIRIFIKKNVLEDDIGKLKQVILANNSISSIEYISSNKAWTNLKNLFPNLTLATHIKTSPLPNTIKAKIKNSKSIEPFKLFLKKYDTYIEKIEYKGLLAQKINNFSKFLKLFGLSLLSLLTLATLLIIINTIRLTIIARQNEISIMQLVGATNSFIKAPFIIEGLLIGFLASIFSIASLKFSYEIISQKVYNKFPFFPLETNPSLLNSLYFSLILLGISIGVIAAYISISRSLNNTSRRIKC